MMTDSARKLTVAEKASFLARTRARAKSMERERQRQTEASGSEVIASVFREAFRLGVLVEKGCS